ncbi:hypothetical protein F441_00795 [Phytophthora nicotianae CJ01A1]|uniref:Uncharacterized protein n=6 Tax=Phytophthora nicotianae TaxID=4792 RepID=W2RIA5_PHYN3|nr:hypothetical protein PPTG_20779 [Phytophthora nicotianae INRA-310]ETI56783.1 hypothetical protein F443_00835 [Phytophthora nicotianae P1569]ETL77566.1 hypothetical protein L917_21492 [Phytophthora nicotianae]ETO58971.1 hypothetical protein F444_22651 [Phytophthora nicotianae P1976]ETP26565.1 hypothetical protein F441_00795 [Phytophthora nicotianae CJ01A1]ETP54528.1 hypothetical protein F442_00766 [Phytophthora nicotianae P10297]
MMSTMIVPKQPDNAISALSFSVNDGFARYSQLCNLTLGYNAAVLVPDLQCKHSWPQHTPHVVVTTSLFISGFFVATATPRS